MKRLLFVDDEPLVLQGLRRMLRSMRHEWKTKFVTSGEKALECLEKTSFDIVISDIYMPGMGGVQLLNKVKSRYPQIIRIILSGHSEKEAIFLSVGVAHQLLAKPCDASTLKNILTRTLALRHLLSNPGLQKLVSTIDALPSIPSLYIKIMDELRLPEPSVSRVAEIISSDVGMTAKILQMINSPFFGLRCRVSSTKHAVSMLGLNAISNFVLTMHFFSKYEEHSLRKFPIERIIKHSMRTGAFAAAIAKAEGQEIRAVDDARVAGFLHDCGKLLLADKLKKRYLDVFENANKEHIPLWETERCELGATHACVGAYLLGLWGLPDSIVEAIGFHHRPAECPHKKFYPLTAVYAANLIEREMWTGSENLMSEISEQYLDSLNLVDRFPEWREICKNLDSQNEI